MAVNNGSLLLVYHHRHHHQHEVYFRQKSIVTIKTLQSKRKNDEAITMKHTKHAHTHRPTHTYQI